MDYEGSDDWFRAQGVVASALRGKASKRLRMAAVHEVRRFAIEETLGDEERRKPGRVARRATVVVRAPRDLEALLEDAPLREEPVSTSDVPPEIVDHLRSAAQRWSTYGAVTGWRLLRARDRIAVLKAPLGETALVALESGRVAHHRRPRLSVLLLPVAIASLLLAAASVTVAHGTAGRIASLVLLVFGAAAVGVWFARRPPSRY